MLDKIKLLIGQPIGVAFKNGLSVSGVLCDADENEICLMEYLYQAKFVQKYYNYEQIQGIYIFPSCENEFLN
ncbi:hypothetical protein MKZ01_09730 [Lysinibacillus endophyticus]|uniref:hypothetical protein n=1 Tax=Ureibacillus endophyticus TaxID=1978490 RepID=UPI003135CA50